LKTIAFQSHTNHSRVVTTHSTQKKENSYEKPPHKARVWQTPPHRLTLRLPNTCFFALAHLDILLTVLLSTNSYGQISISKNFKYWN
tara:strand:- start:2872 stop:3132 length:261 start_codon:yes stop_codon:yes gene_type:complete